MTQYFDHISCINLASRGDRWADTKQECLERGFMPERIEAITGDNNHLAFNQSQHNALKKASDYQSALILEDDCVFKNTEHLADAMNEMPEDWDFLSLGCNLIGSDTMNFKKPTRYSAHLFNLYDCWQSHSNAYSRKLILWILENFNPTEFPIYDEWVRVNVLPNFKCFVIAPQITYQRPGFSNIWNNEGDYTSLFTEGNKLLV